MSASSSDRRWRPGASVDIGVTPSLRSAGGPSVAAPPAPPPDPELRLADPARLAALRETGLLDALPSESFDRLTRLAVRLLGVPVALLSLVDEDREFFLSAQGLGEPWAARRETPLSHSFCKHVVNRSGPLVVEDARNVALLEDNAGISDLGIVAYAGMPLTTADGHTLGSLCAIDVKPRVWSQDDLDALADLAATVTAEVELRHLARRLEREVRLDAVTGLGNRRMWDEEAPRELARARSFGQPLVLALLNLDRFKRFNDRHGNEAGDQLLRETAATWTGTLRDIDVLVRFGGVEFALLMPATGLDPAFDVVENLRGCLTSGITCSAGLAMLREGESAGELLARADAALFRAKRSGRNASALAS